MSRAGPDLSRSRDVTALFADALGVYFRHFGTFIALSAAIVIPVQLIVGGIGLHQLTASYDRSPGTAEAVIPSAVSFNQRIFFSATEMPNTSLPGANRSRLPNPPSSMMYSGSSSA